MSDMVATSLQEAATLAGRGRREEAARLCRDVLSRQPDNLPALLWLGYTSPNQVESENSIARAYELSPQDTTVLKAVEWYNTHFVDPAEAGPNSNSATAETPGEQAPVDRWQSPAGEPVKDASNFIMSQTGSMLIGSAVMTVLSAGAFIVYSGLLFKSQVWTPFALRREIYAVGGFIFFWIALAFTVFSLLDVITPPMKASGFISDRKRIRHETRNRYSGTSVEFYHEVKFYPDAGPNQRGPTFIILKLTEEQYQASEKTNRARAIYSKRTGTCRVYQPLRSVY